jgi:hypothetical protein
MASETSSATSGRQQRRRKAAHPKRRTDVGVVATCVAVLTVVVTGVGISSAMSGKFELATNLAYFATGLSVIAVLVGVMAVITKRGRGLGLFAIALGILASPPILTDILSWAGGLG